MFRVNEACGGKGTLTVKNGAMKIHVSLAGSGIVSLYAGLASNAKSDAKNAINPTKDKVTYQDGYSEEVNGFDIPVPALDEDFNVAIKGKKSVWYDHKVSVKLAE